MSTPSVLDLSEAYDYFTLSILGRSPGVCKIISGGGHKVKIEDQGQPLTLGANSVVRQLPNIVTTWGFRLWRPEHFKARDRWRDTLIVNGAKQNPQVYDIVDLRAPNLKRVIYEEQDPQDNEKPGGPWTWKLTLHQYSRLAPYGGPVKAPQTLVEKALVETGAANAALQKQLDAAKKVKK